jgi:DNA-binding GntR family transcriptional regulator
MDPAFRVTSPAAPIREQVVERLREAILQGVYKPMDRLREKELCELTGSSRTSIREALRQLEAEQLITVVANQGPVVRAVSVTEAMNIYQVRASLESLACRLFIERMTPVVLEHINEIGSSLRAAFEAGDLRAFSLHKDRFYAALAENCGNDVIAAILKTLHARIVLLRMTTLSNPGRPVEAMREVLSIIGFLAERNQEGAEAACRAHIHNAARSLLEMNGGMPPRPTPAAQPNLPG